MTCHNFTDYLQDKLDGAAVAIPPALADHVASCDRCRGRHQASHRLETGLRLLPTPIPSPLLTARIVRAVLAQRRQVVLRRYRVITAAAAAVALILLPLLSYLLPALAPTDPASSNPIIVKVEPPPKPQPQDLDGPTLYASVEKAGTAVSSLSSKLLEKTGQQAAFLLSLVGTGDVPPGTPLVGANQLKPHFVAVESLQEASAGVNSGAQMVANSTQRAVNFFARELPGFKGKGKVR